MILIFSHWIEIKDILQITQLGIPSINYQDTIDKRKMEYNMQKTYNPTEAYIGINLLLDNLKEGTRMNEMKTPMLKGVSGLQKKVTGKVKVITNNKNIKLQETFNFSNENMGMQATFFL